MKKHLSISRTRTAVCAALLLAGGLYVAFSADEKTTVVKVGSSNIHLPAPCGYSDFSNDNDPIRNFAENFCPPGNRLLGVFGSQEFHGSALAGETSPVFDYGLVEVARAMVWRDTSASDFTEAKNSIKREQKTLFARMGPEVKDLVNRLNKDLQDATGESVSLNLDQPVSLGVFEESDHHLSMMMLMRMQLNAGGRNESSKVAASVSFVHLKGKVIFVYAYRAYAGEESVQALKRLTTDWMARLAKANE